MADTIPQGVKVLTDINVLAIGLTENHPAYEDVSPWLQEALDGPNVLLVPDYYPLCAQYIMTRDFEVSVVAARNAVQSLLRSPARIVGTSDTVLLDAYEISAETDHDVYDSFILALARATKADYFVTVDRDFDTLCADEAVTSRNPIPEDKLARLARIDG